MNSDAEYRKAIETRITEYVASGIVSDVPKEILINRHVKNRLTKSTFFKSFAKDVNVSKFEKIDHQGIRKS